MRTRCPSADYILWDEHRALRWSDYRGGHIKGMHEFCAFTHYHVRVESAFLTRDSLRLFVLCEFEPNQSWVGEEACKTNLLLEHEQVHFDIGECSARDLRRVLSQHQYSDGIPKDDIIALSDSVLTYWRTEQERYDRETNHGIKVAVQENWTQRVDSCLQEMSAFENANHDLQLKKQD